MMIYAFWVDAKATNPDLRWEDMRIWKMDLKGPNKLLSFRPYDVSLFRRHGLLPDLPKFLAGPGLRRRCRWLLEP
jgi:hypothetical protein